MVTKANAKYHSAVQDNSNLFVLESYVGKVCFSSRVVVWLVVLLCCCVVAW